MGAACELDGQGWREGRQGRGCGQQAVCRTEEDVQGTQVAADDGGSRAEETHAHEEHEAQGSAIQVGE